MEIKEQIDTGANIEFELRKQISLFKNLYIKLDTLECTDALVASFIEQQKEWMRYGIMFWEGDIAHRNKQGYIPEHIKNTAKWEQRVLLVKLYCAVSQAPSFEAEFSIFLQTNPDEIGIIQFMEEELLQRQMAAMLQEYYRGRIGSST